MVRQTQATSLAHRIQKKDGIRKLRFGCLTGGEANDVLTAADLLDGQTADGIIADRAHDTSALREMIEEADIEVVIPSK